jgi:hypothetical protein
VLVALGLHVAAGLGFEFEQTLHGFVSTLGPGGLLRALELCEPARLALFALLRVGPEELRGSRRVALAGIHVDAPLRRVLLDGHAGDEPVGEHLGSEEGLAFVQRRPIRGGQVAGVSQDRA